MRINSKQLLLIKNILILADRQREPATSITVPARILLNKNVETLGTGQKKLMGHMMIHL